MKNWLKITILGLTLSLVSCVSVPELIAISSPDGQTRLDVNLKECVRYSLSRHGEAILRPSAIALMMEDSLVLGNLPQARSYRIDTLREHIEAPLYRQSSFDEICTELVVEFKGDYALRFRLYNSGLAYRFETQLADSCIIINELAEFNFAGDPKLFAAYSDGFSNAFQSCYEQCLLSELATDKPILLPMYADCGAAGRVLICESDLESYPGMFLSPSVGGVKGVFAQLPDSTYHHARRYQEKVVTRLDYIAQVEGGRTYPWRIVVVADNECELPTNNLVYALGAESRIGDSSWVKSGKVAWEWWNDWGLTGVDFKPGINTQTYKAYIDFAADYGLEYVVLDEGWSDPKGGDVMSVVDDLDLEVLVNYAEDKNVGLMLWVVGNVLDAKLQQACEHYSRMGICGFKVDFIDRDDQKAVELVYRLAEVAAKHKLILDLHGMYKPTGLNRTYPNIVNFEGVFGLEELKWSNPNMPLYDVTFPFIRMVQGPVDYTQGAFRNATRDGFKIDYYNPMSQGTRAHQVATYLVFDSPLVMLCDSPTSYASDEPCARYIASLPVVFDSTKVIGGQIGEYIITARKRKDSWYVGALTNWTPRTVEVDLSMLDINRTYTATLLSDHGQAASEPTKYQITTQSVDRESKLEIELAPGGGFAIKIQPID